MKRPKHHRLAHTQMELVITTVLLAATLVSITAYRRQAVANTQVTARASLAHARTLNLRREISTWEYEQVTEARIEQVEVEDSPLLNGAGWSAEVSDITEPVVGKQVILKLSWQEGELTRSGPQLCFWVRRP